VEQVAEAPVLDSLVPETFAVLCPCLYLALYLYLVLVLVLVLPFWLTSDTKLMV